VGPRDLEWARESPNGPFRFPPAGEGSGSPRRVVRGPSSRCRDPGEVWIVSLHHLLPRLVLLGTLPCLGGGTDVQQAPPPEVREELVQRTEHFLLEWQAEGEPPAARRQGDIEVRRSRVLGLARLRKRHEGAELQLEMELDYMLEDLRLYAVERLGERASRLIYREMAAARGRTLRAEWSRDGTSLETAEWDRGGRRARSASLEDGGVLPQYLLELARGGSVLSGRFLVFDPLTGGLESQELATTYETGAEEQLQRVVRLVRGDGTLAGEYRFTGDALTAFRLQNGRIEARAVSEELYEEARALYHAGPAAGSDQASELPGE